MGWVKIHFQVWAFNPLSVVDFMDYWGCDTNYLVRLKITVIGFQQGHNKKLWNP